MSTKIEWTHTINPDGTTTPGRTWNPTTGCNKISAGCRECYAEIMHRRQQAMNPHKYRRAFSAGVDTHENELLRPLGWKKPCKVFVNSMSDLFHSDVLFEFIDKVFATMAITPHITYQILTKRPDNMLFYFKQNRWHKVMTDLDILAENDKLEDVCTKAALRILKNNLLPNVWLGTSVENQAQADKRIPDLLETPAAVKFLSCEPLIGPVNLKNVNGAWDCLRGVYTAHEVPGGGYQGKIQGAINWVICGGESGNKARPMHPDWARSLRDQCQSDGVPFFFKQWGQHGRYGHGNFPDNPLDTNPEAIDTIVTCGKHAAGNKLDGITHQNFPNK